MFLQNPVVRSCLYVCTSACILFISSTEPRESVLTLLLYASFAVTGRGGEGLDSSSNTLLWEKEGSRPAEQNENVKDVSSLSLFRATSDHKTRDCNIGTHPSPKGARSSH